MYNSKKKSLKISSQSSSAVSLCVHCVNENKSISRSAGLEPADLDIDCFSHAIDAKEIV